MMICRWTTLMAQQRQPNYLIRHPICQIRARKKCCGPPAFSGLSTLFVPLMQTSILTSEIAFSSTMLANVWSTRFCQISEFAQIEQKMVSWAVSFLAFRNRADHNFFSCPYLADWMSYKAIWLTLLWCQSKSTCIPSSCCLSTYFISFRGSKLTQIWKQ